jgi:hypothetical protein
VLVAVFSATLALVPLVRVGATLAGAVASLISANVLLLLI